MGASFSACCGEELAPMGRFYKGCQVPGKSWLT